MELWGATSRKKYRMVMDSPFYTQGTNASVSLHFYVFVKFENNVKIQKL